MPVITDLVADARREGRIAVLVDGEPAAVVGLDAVERLGIRVGGQVDEVALAEADADCALYDRAMRLIAARSRSAADIRRRLRREGAEPARIDRVVHAMMTRGFLDDAAHARSVTRSRVRSKGASARRIKQELTRQGVAPEIADEAVVTVFADEAIDEATIATQVARRRAAQLADLPAPKRRQRLYGFLARRGYSPDIVKAAVDAVYSLNADDDRRRHP
jgi:regulatory protein